MFAVVNVYTQSKVKSKNFDPGHNKHTTLKHSDQS